MALSGPRLAVTNSYLPTLGGSSGQLLAETIVLPRLGGFFWPSSCPYKIVTAESW